MHKKFSFLGLSLCFLMLLTSLAACATGDPNSNGNTGINTDLTTTQVSTPTTNPVTDATTPTSAPASGDTLSQGTATLHSKGLFDFDKGRELPALETTITADVTWSADRLLSMEGVVRNYNLGLVDFNALTLNDLQGYTYTYEDIVGTEGTSNHLVNMDVFAIKTGDGNYAKVMVVTYGSDLTLKWVTYKTPA